METIDQRWRKSSYSGNGGGSCVEVCTSDPDAVVVRDSKDKAGPTLGFTPEAWSAFVRGIKRGDFNLA
jgi:hypothetical protein